MKGDCTKIHRRTIGYWDKFPIFARSSLSYTDEGATGYLCTRTDSDVQEVESGSSTLMMTEQCLSEFAPCYGVDSSFMFSSSSGFARTLLSGNVDDSPHRPFVIPCAGKNTARTSNKIHTYMKKALISLALCIAPAIALAQVGNTAAQATATPDGQVVYNKVKQSPEFPGGFEALEQWKKQHIIYPEQAIQSGTEGQVVVRFIIRETGEVTDAEILRSIDPALDKEALRLVNSMPKWMPGKQDGKAVSVRWDEPVTFTLPTAENNVVMESETKEDNKVYDVVEQQPSFPDGQGALMQWLIDNIKYPVIAAENGIEGRVMVQFIVNKNGDLSDVRVARGVDPSLDKEALRLISIMPKWIPGKQNGKIINVRYTLPITFKLQ